MVAAMEAQNADREDPKNWADDVGSHGGYRVKPMWRDGHCFYCRKCMEGEKLDQETWERQVGGIILPEVTADYSLVVEVLAKGERVGWPLRSDAKGKDHALELNRSPLAIDTIDIPIGALLLCENNHIGIEQSPINKDEFLVEESAPLGWIVKQ